MTPDKLAKKLAKLALAHVGFLTCSRCPNTHGSGVAYGWIDEVWPTIGGGTLHVTICPDCRRPWS